MNLSCERVSTIMHLLSRHFRYGYGNQEDILDGNMSRITSDLMDLIYTENPEGFGDMFGIDGSTTDYILRRILAHMGECWQNDTDYLIMQDVRGPLIPDVVQILNDSRYSSAGSREPLAWEPVYASLKYCASQYPDTAGLLCRDFCTPTPCDQSTSWGMYSCQTCPARYEASSGIKTFVDECRYVIPAGTDSDETGTYEYSAERCSYELHY